MTETTAAGIEDAFRKLQILPEREEYLPSIVQALAHIPRGEVGTPRREFREIGQEGARKELSKIANASAKLKKLIDDLSQTSITALADAGLLQVVHHRTLSAFLGQLETSARNADVSRVPKTQGKGQPPNNLASGVAAILASNYARLTGKAPAVSTRNNGTQDIPYGPYFDLVVSVFEVLEIDASPEATARAAAKEFKDRK